METRNRLTATRGGGETERGKEGEGSSEGTGINDPWAWTTGWGLTGSSGVGQGRAIGENWDNCNRTTLKKKKKKIGIVITWNYSVVVALAIVFSTLHHNEAGFLYHQVS